MEDDHGAKIHVLIVDDIDGGQADETILFGLDGVNYEIDLSQENSSRLREALAPWVGSARRVGGRKQAGGIAGKTGPKREDLDKVRVWARHNGFPVSERGRVASNILQAYDAAH